MIMADDVSISPAQIAVSNRPKDPNEVPTGYRQAFVSAAQGALTVSFLYLRFVAFEPTLGDEWTDWGRVAAFFGVLSCIFLGYSLWRGVGAENDDRRHYDRTVCWFRFGLILLTV